MMLLMVDVHDDNDFDLHSDRDSISGSVQLLLDEATEPWGIKVSYSAIIVITTIISYNNIIINT